MSLSATFAPTDRYFAPLAFTPAWHCLFDWLGFTREWSDGGTRLPAVQVRHIDLGYRGDTVEAQLEQAAVLACAPVDYDLLERLRLARVAYREDPSRLFALTLSKNGIGAMDEVIRTHLSRAEAEAAQALLDVQWRAHNPRHGFGSTRYAAVTPHPEVLTVRIPYAIVSGYQGSSPVVDMYRMVRR